MKPQLSRASDDHIRRLFEMRCECRPLDTARLNHSHDCDVGCTNACRTALHGIIVQEIWLDEKVVGKRVICASELDKQRARDQCEKYIERLSNADQIERIWRP